MSLFWLVMIPVIIAIIGYLMNQERAARFFIVVQIGLLALSFSFLYEVNVNGPIVCTLGTFDAWLDIVLVADNISMLFVTLTCFLFLAMLVFNYHKHYMNHLFLFLFIVLQGLINAIFLTYDFFNIYALVEVSTVTVSILIMFKKDSQSIYDGMVYLLTNLVSMTFFLIGVGYIYKMFGTLNMSVVKDMMVNVSDTRDLILPYSLLITSIGLKSAVMPLFSWLPRAHGTPAAPSIVSAILSGLYVKGGVYLFIRFQDTFKSQLDTSTIFLILGILTAVIGFIFALSQTDIKLILAYHTVSQIGLIIFGLSIGSDYSYYGSIYHIINHAVFKSTLFLTAGMIIEEYETRDIREIRGVFKRMPYVAMVIIVAIFGITGAPLFNGSVSKYLIQKGANYQVYLEYCLVIINLGTIVSFIKYSHMLFGDHKERFKVPLNQKIAIGTLSFITFLGGIFGQYIVHILFDVHIEITFLSTMNKLAIYVISLLLGYLFYTRLYKRIRFFKTMREIELSFNEIAFSIVFFFFGFLATMMMTYN